MLVSVYNKLSLFSAHILIMFVHIYMNMNKLCLNQWRYSGRFILLLFLNPADRASIKRALPATGRWWEWGTGWEHLCPK